MNEEKQQKFTAKVRRGLVWVHSVAGAELAKKKAEATGVQDRRVYGQRARRRGVRADLDRPEQRIESPDSPPEIGGASSAVSISRQRERRTCGGAA